MKQYRTVEEIKKFDIFKVITFLILVILLCLAAARLQPTENPPAVTQATSEPTATTAPTETPPPTATPQPTATTAPTETPPPTATAVPATAEAEPKIAMPVVNLPGGEVTPGQVALTGTGEPGSEVEVVIDGQVVGKTTVGSDGTWSYTADLPEPGDYQISVQNVDAGGQVIAASEPATLTLTAPAPPVTAPTLDRPSGELTAGPVTLTGGGEPGSQVEVVVNGQVVGKATVGDDGTWSLAAELSPAGDYEITVQSVDADGKVLAASEPIKLTVAEKATPPTLDRPGANITAGPVTLTGTGEPGSEVEVVIDGQVVGKTTVGGDGTWSYTADLPEPGDYQISVQNVNAVGKVLAASEPTALTVAAPPTLDRPSGELTVGLVTLTGGGEPGSQIEVVVDGQVVGKVTVGDDGTWSLDTELSPAGDYEITVQSVDADGKVLTTSEPVKFTVTAEEKGQAYIVQADDWLSKLALKFYNDMMRYPVIVEATNAKAREDSSFTVITNPDLIEIGQKLWIPEVAP